MVDAPPIPIADESAERRKRRFIALLWVLFFALLLAIEIQDHWNEPSIRWWQPILWMSTSGAVATVWLWLHLRDRKRAARYLDRPWLWFWRQLRWFPLIAIVFICVVYALRHGFYALLGLRYEHESWGFVFLYETIKLWLFLGLWLGILFAFESFAHTQEQQRRLVALQKSLSEAQLQQLKAQLRPHFLFNALNTISSLMQIDVARADRLLRQLADLLRASLRSDQEELTTFANELEILRLYARIMQQRYEDRVTLSWNIAADTESALLPTMLLQPVLENAFKHGVERTTVQAHIEVEARRAADRLDIRIRNSGAIEPMPGEGVGLRNCEARLRAHYGDTATFAFSVDENGAETRVLIPWQERAA